MFPNLKEIKEAEKEIGKDSDYLRNILIQEINFCVSSQI